MKAIVYTTNAGSTEQYAKLLRQKERFPLAQRLYIWDGLWRAL